MSSAGLTFSWSGVLIWLYSIGASDDHAFKLLAFSAPSDWYASYHVHHNASLKSWNWIDPHLDIDVDVEDDQKNEWNDSVNSQVEVYQVDLRGTQVLL